MRLLGFEISRTKQQGATTAVAAMDSRAWWPLIRESFAGAWQRNVTVNRNDVLAYAPVFTCITMIAADIAKNRIKLVEQSDDSIWTEIYSPAFSPVLAKPNHFQNRNQFFESWMLSKLIFGNTYVLMERDNRSVVIALYVLDPMRTKVLIAPDGSVYYQLSNDLLSGVTEQGVTIPASEIIHDRWNCLFHPLCGISPIFAAGLAAQQGLNIQTHSTKFFGNSARPSGILTAPGFINQETADMLKQGWEENYGGENVGRVAVLGDGLKFESLSATAEASQMIEQLKMTAETCCATFHVPGFLAGIANAPPYGNVESLWQMYYGQCLQQHFESIESCLDEGLGLTTIKGRMLGTEFDVDNLLRMDALNAIRVATEGLKGVFTPNEARARFDKKGLAGGDSVYLQQQQFSLEALAKRDAKADPFAVAPAPSSEPPKPDPTPTDPTPTKGLSTEAIADLFPALLMRELTLLPRIVNGHVKYSDDEPRDDQGQWTDGGGGGGGGSGVHAVGVAAAGQKKDEWTGASKFTTAQSILDSAPANQAALAKEAKAIGTAAGATFVDPGVKSEGSLGRKLSEGRSPQSITDAVRGGFNVDSPQQADAIVAGLASKFAIADEGWATTPAGYFDRKLMVKFPDGMVGEVQMWPPGMLAAKDSGGGHKIYEAWRLAKTGPDSDKLLGQMTALYGGVRANLGADWKSTLESRAAAWRVKYADDQPRDDHGEWTDGGGGGGSSSSGAGGPTDRHLAAWFKGTSNERSPDSLRKSDEFAAAISSLPTVDGTVYRGARPTPTAAKAITEGSVYTFTKSSSATTDPKIADAFASGLGVGGGDGRVKVVFEIQRSGAKDVTAFAKKLGRNEGEAIIPKGTSYKVTSVKSRHTVSGTKIRVVMGPP